MELQLEKESFLCEFTKVHSIENCKATERSEGFRYIHDMTTKKLAEGGEFKIGNLDFNRFSYDDLVEYMEYYNENLEPKIRLAGQLFRVIQDAESVFVSKKRYF